jgi:hypothetical protein
MKLFGNGEGGHGPKHVFIKGGLVKNDTDWHNGGGV